ncbi:MAG: ABC transporter permease [Chlorobi bacterium]|nr:ABC transporter permease [Chlorobiota bacterium]MBX7217064.1 ABC transporter permease [Candidatus Kapabacteria bacterium]
MNWNRILQIARWEFTQKAKAKSFILSLILTPAMMLLFGFLPSMLAGKGNSNTAIIGLIDSTGTVAAPLAERLKLDTLPNGQPSYLLQRYPTTPATTVAIDSAIAAADREILAEKMEGAVVIRDSAGVVVANYRSANPSNIRLVSSFENQIEKILNVERMVAAGIDTAAWGRANQSLTMETVKISEKGAEKSEGFLQTFFAAYIGIILFMILVLTTGQSLVRSLVEEKSNRIMELLVSSGTPQELMWGKLLGLSALGATQVAAWVIIGVAAVGYFAVVISPDIVASFPLIFLYLLLGYSFYASLFIGIGSLVTTEQEAQVITSYLTMLLVAPMAFAFVVMQDPDSFSVTALSYVPLLTPTLMMIRLVTKMPSPTEIAGSIAVMVAATGVVIWASGKIFRTAILMYGKRPTFREVLRWLREA